MYYVTGKTDVKNMPDTKYFQNKIITFACRFRFITVMALTYDISIEDQNIQYITDPVTNVPSDINYLNDKLHR